MSRNNCFDVVRLLAAIAVIYFHHSLMFGMEPPKLDKGFSIGNIAVQVFFSISGFLIAMSFTRSSNFLIYMGKRVKRIFPAVTFCAFIMVYFFASFYKDNIFNYVTSWDTFINFLRISTLYGRNVPGLWSEISSHTESNGPLWTLPYELVMYVILGASLSMHNSWKTPAFLLILCFFVTTLFREQLNSVGAYYATFSKLAEFGLCFFTGSLLFMTITAWNTLKVRVNLIAISLILITTLRGGNDMLAIGSIMISILVIMISLSFKERFIDGRFDISYGIYIWGWPLQILVIHYKPFGISEFVPSLIFTYLIVVIASSLSWAYIESPILKRKTQLNLNKDAA
ncbi:acyltransferase [Cronobacter sakazakii]|nr:acyltransferase [Cronobacter sakazakii]